MLACASVREATGCCLRSALDGALEHVRTGALRRRAADEHDEFFLGLVHDLEHRAGLDVHESADGNLVPLRRVAKVHCQRSAQRDESLILNAFGVARPNRTRLVADQVRARVPQANEFGERGAKAPREALVLLPLELLGVDDPERHRKMNDAEARGIPNAGECRCGWQARRG
jgi:hypothetical protein